MNIKKLLLIIFLMFIITGCNANYTLEINDNKIKETFSVVETDKEKFNETDDFNKTFSDYAKLYGEELDFKTNTNELYSEEDCRPNCTYYNKKYINEDGKIGFELNFDFNFNEYAYSSIANEIIPGFSTTYDGKMLTIKGGSSWKFLNDYKTLDQIDIVINTNYKVVSTNLRKNNNNYVWTIKNEDVKQNKNYYIVMDTNTIVETKNNNDVLYFLIIFLIIIFGLIGYEIYKRKKNNN